MTLFDEIAAVVQPLADAADAQLAALQVAYDALQAEHAQCPPIEVGPFIASKDNTGCRIPKASLVHYPHTVTSTHPVTGLPLQRGDVISGVRVPQFAITVPGVTVRDCWVDGVGLPYTNPGVKYHRLIDCRDSSGGASDADLVVYEYVTVAPATHSYLNVAFQGANFRAYRCNIRYVTDAFSPHSTGGQTVRAADIIENYAENFYIDEDPNQGDNITHNDFVQSAGKLRRLRIEGNTVWGAGNTAVGLPARPRTSNILLQSGEGGYTGEGVIIRNNRFMGHQSTGSTINIPIALNCPFVFEDNQIYSTGKNPKVLIHSTTRNASTSSIFGNVTETGSAVPINNA